MAADEYVPLRSRANGQAVYEFRVQWSGEARKQIVCPCVISPKRIEIIGWTFDRATGKRVSKYNPHLKYLHLIAFRADGEQVWRPGPGVEVVWA